MPEHEEPRITSEQVLAVLQTCYDPCCKERGVSVVEPGLIQGVTVAENGHDVRVELLLTSGWCPFSTHLLQMIEQNVGAIEGVGAVDTEIVWGSVSDGVDTFIFENGLIQVQTAHFTRVTK